MSKEGPTNNNSKNPAQVGGRLLKWRRNDTTEPVDYAATDAGDVMNAIIATTRAGGAIMFGLTADGGAYSICVLLNNEKIKEYVHTPAELSSFARHLVEELLL